MYFHAKPGYTVDHGIYLEELNFDASKYGGAPLLGLNGLVVKAHGNSKAMEITTSINQCVTFKQQDINGKIKQFLTVETAAEEE